MRLLVLFVFLLGFLFVLDKGTHEIEASHSYSPPVLWGGLEVGGIHRLKYSVCAANPLPTWEHAIEIKWDVVLPGWSFDKMPGCGAVLKIDWETPGPAGQCNGFADATGCTFINPSVAHGGHFDIGNARTWFDNDPANPYRFPSWGLNWQIALAAHEWGHMLGLADEAPGVNMCTGGTLMGIGDISRKASDAWCPGWPGVAGVAGPTVADRNSVLCVIYALCPAHNNLQNWVLHATTVLHQTDSTWEFDIEDHNILGRQDAIGVKKQAPSGKSEVHALAGEGVFGYFTLQAQSGLSTTDANWQFEFDDWNGDGIPDMFGIRKQAPSGRTEVHIYSGAGSFQVPLAGIITSLHSTTSAWEFAVADWNLQGKPDLIGVKKSGGASTEVHIYSGESNFQADIEHTATPLQPTNALWTFQAGDFNNDAIPDLFAIATQNTGSGMTEAHILSGARDGNGNEFQTWLLHAALPLGYVNPYVTAFAVADWDRNGNADLFVIAKQGVSSTEVHALAG